MNREELEKIYDQVLDTKQLLAEYVVEGFLAPFCVVHRKSDGQQGTFAFQHSPRFYYDWHAV